MRPFLAGTAAVVLLLSACGDDDSGGDDAYRDVLVEEIRDTEEAGFEVSDDDAECLADRFLDVLGGSEALEAEGITPEELAESESPADLGLELDDDDGAAFGEAFTACDLPLADLIVQSIESSEGEEVSDETKACIDENFDEEGFARLVGQGFATGEDFDAQDPESVQVILDLLEACPELGQLGGG